MLQIFSLLLTGVLSSAFGGMCKKIGKVKACVMGMGFFAVSFYLDGLFTLIMQGFFGDGQKLPMQILGMAISKSIEVVALLGMWVLVREQAEGINASANLASGIRGQHERNYHLSDDGCKYHDGLTLAISAFFLLLGIWVWWQNGAVGTRIIVMLVLLMLLSGYYISLYFHLRKQKVKAVQSNEADRRREAEAYLENVENNYQRTRELWHDLKNHINLMNLLLQDEKYGELKDYLRIFNEDVDSLTLPVKSGNVIVDALLSDKTARAKREKVEVSLALCDLTGLSLQPDEICGLLGNLLDNALEANRKLREGRFLEVTCKALEECYYIRVRNAVNSCASGGMRCDGQTVSTGQKGNNELRRFQTTKSDLRNQVGHGLGLRSVERIVHGCGGEMAVESGEKYFTVVVRLPR